MEPSTTQSNTMGESTTSTAATIAKPTVYDTPAVTDDRAIRVTDGNMLGKIDTVRINEFLKRDLLLATAGFSTTIDSWNVLTMYINHTAIQQKLKFFKVIQGVLKVTAVFTHDPYATGFYIMSAVYDNNLTLTNDRWTDYTRDHVEMDLSTTNTMSISLPISLRFPYLDMGEQSAPDLDKVKVHIVPIIPGLSTQTGTAAPSNYRLYASLELSTIGIPTAFGTNSIYTATTIGDEEEEFLMPTNATFARSLAQKRSSTTLFNRPRLYDNIPYPHEPNLASYAMNTRVKNFALDPFNGVTRSLPNLNSSSDNLSFAMMKRPGIIFSAAWTTAMVPDNILTVIAVTPGISIFSTPYYYPTPLAYGSQLAKMWRGSIKYKFKLPANRFVRGKLRIIWAPNQLPVSSANTVLPHYDTVVQNAITIMIDVTVTTEVEFEIPWGQIEPFKATTFCMKSDQISSTRLDTATNGWLYVVIDEPLMCPSSAYVQGVIITACAGSDFQLAVPDVGKIQYYTMTGYTDNGDNVQLTPMEWVEATSLGSSIISPDGTNVDTGFYRDTLFTSTTIQEMNNEFNDNTISILPGHDTMAPFTHNIGEVFTSFRPFCDKFSVLKREAVSESPQDTITGKSIIKYTIPQSPPIPTYYVNGGTNYTRGYFFTPMTYLSLCYLGYRGSIRYQMSVNDIPDFTSMAVARQNGVPRRCTIFPQGWEKSPFMDPDVGTGENAFNVRSGEPIVVEVPYQHSCQFVPPYLSNTSNPCLCIQYTFYGQAVPNHTIRVAAGEDFNLVQWNGVPPIQFIRPALASSGP